MEILSFFDRFFRSGMITSLRGTIHQGLEAFSEHSRMQKQELIQRKTLFLGEYYISAGQTNLFQLYWKIYIGTVCVW